jgi:uncharacterized protein YggT (Ycf19 family)
MGSAIACARSAISSSIFRSSDQARTTPATEFTSAMAMASSPRSAARRAYSSGCEPPVRKVKFEVMESSANPMGRSIFTFCSHLESPGTGSVGGQKGAKTARDLPHSLNIRRKNEATRRNENPMSETLSQILEIILAPFRHFTNPSDRLSYVYLATALMVAIIVYIVNQAREGRLNAGGLVRWLLPREVLMHPSCQTDFAYFFVVRILRAAVYGSVVVSSAAVSALTISGLTALLGPSAPTVEPNIWISIAVTLTIVLILDFVLWFMHYVYHVVPSSGTTTRSTTRPR